MRKFQAAATFLTLLASVGFAFGQTPAAATYVLTEDENPSANTATAYTLNTTTGVATQYKVLSTGGEGLGGGFFAATDTGVTSNLSCIFIADAGTNDIAAFEAPTYKKVGNYTNSAVNWSNNGSGGSIALSPNGKFLYGAYSGSENIGAWSVGTGCALTFIDAYTPSAGPDLFATLHVTPDGKALLVPEIDYGIVTLFSIKSTTGALTEVTNATFENLSTCQTDGCYPTGFDISGDSKVAFFGDATISAPLALGLNIDTTTGTLTNPTAFPLTVGNSLANSNFPWFPASSYAKGTGPIVIGMAGYEEGDENSGVVVADVTETPTLKSVSSSLFATIPEGTCTGCGGTVETHGAIAVAAIFPNLVNVYTINPKTGAFTLLKSNTDANAVGLLSLHVIPETR
jgi:hypothetical protein